MDFFHNQWMEHIFKVSMFTPSEMSSQKYIQPKKTPRAINPIPLTEELFPEQPMPSVQKGKPNIQTQQLTPNISISLSIYLCVGTFIMSPCHRIIGVCWSRGCPKRLFFFYTSTEQGLKSPPSWVSLAPYLKSTTLFRCQFSLVVRGHRHLRGETSYVHLRFVKWVFTKWVRSKKRLKKKKVCRETF